MGVRYAIGLPNVGQFGDVRTLLELAVAAEGHGWDGVHLWDHLLYHEPEWPVASPIVAASAIAAATQRIRIIVTLTLPRRQVQDVAQDVAAIDALSGQRLTVVGVIGSMDREYSEFGLDSDPRARGKALDDRIARLREMWGGPIWAGGRWPYRRGLRRAARLDGALLTFEGYHQSNIPVEDFQAATAFVKDHGARGEIAVEGATEGPGSTRTIEPYAEAGLTWWIEALGWWRGDVSAAAARIAAGPPD